MRQDPELAVLLPSLTSLAADRSIPVQWRTRLSASIALLRSTSGPGLLPGRMRSLAALLREMAADLDGEGGEL